MAAHTNREQQRQTLVQAWLTRNGVDQNGLHQSSMKYLDDWARQVLVVESQPSASFDEAISNLSRAVEAQVKESLGSVSELDSLRTASALGTMGLTLERLAGGKPPSQKLESLGYQPGFVYKTLPRKLLKLADLRNPCTHADPDVPRSGADRHERAQDLAAEILKRLPVHDTGQRA